MSEQIALPLGRPVRSSREARRVLEQVHGGRIALARSYAVRIAREQGTVTSRDVRAAMAADGHLDGGRETWLGPVFQDGTFEAIGYRTYRDAERNCHSKPIRSWRLREEVTP